MAKSVPVTSGAVLPNHSARTDGYISSNAKKVGAAVVGGGNLGGGVNRDDSLTNASVFDSQKG